jgi:DNA (cytosine-5)-methyltransferase 1
MERGSGTRSGLLWEVERIIKECAERHCRPNVLIMENVPGVIGEQNKSAFSDWENQLRRLGYSNYHRILNAKDYAIPQNRRRCFMVSILGDYGFEFPPRMPLKYRLKDYIEDEVDESYYLSEEIVRMFRKHTEEQIAKGNGFRFEPTKGEGAAGTITTREGQRTDDNFIEIGEDPDTDGEQEGL